MVLFETDLLMLQFMHGHVTSVEQYDSTYKGYTCDQQIGTMIWLKQDLFEGC